MASVAAAAAGEEIGGRQWIALQQKLVPRNKDASSAFSRNALRRQRDAIREAHAKGYLRLLDGSLVLEQWGADSLSELELVRRISLPSSRVQALDDVTLLSCTRLVICNLPHCFLSDLGAFYGSVALLKLDLSNNQIERVPPAEFWVSLPRLRVLYLHGNTISHKESLRRLSGCRQLHLLTLHSSPLALTPHYRHHTVNTILSLRALDDYVISDEEIVEHFHLPSPYTQLSPPFKMDLYLQCSETTSYQHELQQIMHLLLAIDRVLSKHSPVIVVQRWVRGWMVRKALERSSNTSIRAFLKKYRHFSTNAPPPNTATNDRISTVRSSNPYPLLPPLLLPPTTRQTISARVPNTSDLPKHDIIGNLHSDTAVTSSSHEPLHRHHYHHHHHPPPPPSPTAPTHFTNTHTIHPPYSHLDIAAGSLPIESHTLTINPNSSQLKHSIEINLSQLHSHLDERYLHKRTHQPQREEKGGGERRGVEKGRGGGGGGGKRVRLESKKPESSENQQYSKNKKSEVDRVRGQGVRKRASSTEVVLQGSGAKDAIEICGDRVNVIIEDGKMEKLSKEKKEEGKKMREAEEEIKKMVNETKEDVPPKKLSPPTTLHGAQRLSKEELAYQRIFETMALSSFHAVDRIHRAKKTSDAWRRKSDHVTKMRQERMRRRQKIEDVGRRNKEVIENWRAAEENNLAKLRDENLRKDSEQILKKSLQRDINHTRRAKEKEDWKFSLNFTQQNMMVGREQVGNDRLVAENEKSEELKDQVQLRADETRRRREEGRAVQEIRAARVTWEGVMAKRDISAKMVEAAAQQLMEARWRVGREALRRNTTRASIMAAQASLRAGASLPPSGRLSPPLQLDLRSESELVLAGETVLQQSPIIPGGGAHRQRFSHAANRSWQRGALVLEERERQRGGGTGTGRGRRGEVILSECGLPCFPAIEESAGEVPFIHPPMRPGNVARSLVSTPFQSELTDSRPVSQWTTTDPHRTTPNQTSTTPNQNRTIPDQKRTIPDQIRTTPKTLTK